MPMQTSDEATARQLELARAQGRVLEDALREMVEEEARGAEIQAGDYLIGWAAEEAEGMYRFRDGDLEWEDPRDANCHLEICVRDAFDGRFVPGLEVHATLALDGEEVGTHLQPFLWHPWLHHYGRNWQVPRSGVYSLRVRVEPPTFPRHDRINGLRFCERAVVDFAAVAIETGQKHSPPPARGTC